MSREGFARTPPSPSISSPTAPRHGYLFAFLLIVAAPFFTTAAPQCPPAQRDSLLELKDGFSFTPFAKLASWSPNKTCCSWEGVACDSVSGEVVGLDVSSSSISGKLWPDSLGKLGSLYRLNMSNNYITGEIPRSLGDLAGLESLDLSLNSLTGEIPSSLTSLSFLNLSYNNLVGQIPTSPLQLDTFSNWSFIGNVGLCGEPLTRRCNAAAGGSPEAGTPEEHGGGARDDSEPLIGRWERVSAMWGFCFGLGAVVGPPLVSRKARLFYNAYLDRMLPSWCCVKRTI